VGGQPGSDRPWLTRTDRPSGARFLPLETVRAFGYDELRARGETPAAQEAMVGWALDLVREVEAGIHAAREPFWDDLVRQELPNIRAVRRYLADHSRLADLVTLLRGLSDWAEFRDVSEVWRWQLDLLEQARDAGAEIRLPALAMSAAASWLSGRLDRAGPAAQEVYHDCPTGWLGAQALNMLASVELFAGRFEGAARFWQERAAIEVSPHLRPHSLALAALALGYAGRLEPARLLAAEALADADRLGSATGGNRRGGRGQLHRRHRDGDARLQPCPRRRRRGSGAAVPATDRAVAAHRYLDPAVDHPAQRGGPAVGPR
jgi:hypothetical protein